MKYSVNAHKEVVVDWWIGMCKPCTGSGPIPKSAVFSTERVT